MEPLLDYDAEDLPVREHSVGNMEIYKNPYCKKVRGSHVLEVTCAYCKCFIANYQKVGESGFVKMYNERIIDTSHELSDAYSTVITVDKQADSVDYALMGLLTRDDNEHFTMRN